MRTSSIPMHRGLTAGLVLLALCIARISIGSVDVSLSVSPTPPNIHLTISGTVEAVDYKIYRSLSLSGTWTPIGTVIGTGGNATFDDTDPTIGEAQEAFYRVVVSDATLSDLSSTAGDFTPAFSPGATAYSASVANGVASTTVTATSADPAATLEVSINGGSFSTLASGVESDPLSLEEGVNVVEVRVTAQDGSTIRTYTLSITRASSPLSKLIPQTNWIVSVDSEELTFGSWGPANPGISAFDGDPNTFWHTEWVASQPMHPHEIRIDLGAEYTVTGFRQLPRQDGILNGRIAGYEFYVSTVETNRGAPVSSGTFANSTSEKEVLLTAPITGRYVWLTALSGYDVGNFATSLAELNVLTTDNLPAEGQIISPSEDVTIPVGGSVSFSGSGTDLEGDLPPTFHWNFGAGSGIADSTDANPGEVQFNTPGTYLVTLTVSDSLGNADPGPEMRVVTVQAPLPVIPQTSWIVSVNSEELTAGSWGPATPGTSAFDGDPNTFWHTEWVASQPRHPHEIQIDLGAEYTVTGFRQLPRQDGIPNGRIAGYEFYVSTDQTNRGAPVSSGTFANSKSEKEVLLTAPITGRYVWLKALGGYNYGNFATSLAELNVLTQQQQ